MNEMSNTGNVHVIQRSSILLLFLGWISAIASLIILPMVFGVFGVIMGIMATKNGSRAGLTLIVTNIALMAVGMILNGVFYNYFRHFIGL